MNGGLCRWVTSPGLEVFRKECHETLTRSVCSIASLTTYVASHCRPAVRILFLLFVLLLVVAVLCGQEYSGSLLNKSLCLFQSVEVGDYVPVWSRDALRSVLDRVTTEFSDLDSALRTCSNAPQNPSANPCCEFGRESGSAGFGSAGFADFALLSAV